jgi:hypothetical protein
MSSNLSEMGVGASTASGPTFSGPSEGEVREPA